MTSAGQTKKIKKFHTQTNRYESLKKNDALPLGACRNWIFIFTAFLLCRDRADPTPRTFQASPLAPIFQHLAFHDSGTIRQRGNKQHHQQRRWRRMRKRIEMTPTPTRLIDKRDKRTRHSLSG